MRILVFNCGSSSLTYKAFEVDSAGNLKVFVSGKAHRVGVTGTEPSFIEHHYQGEPHKDVVPIRNHREAGALVLKFVRDNGIAIDYCGHRFVHGGSYFSGSAVIDQDAMTRLRLCLPLAPIHNPMSLSVINECRRTLPGVGQYVTFDSAFHSSMPDHAYTYALPKRIVDEYGFRKFGFHGLSYSYVTSEAPRFLGVPPESLRIVACHLGTGGSSVAAMRGGQSIDTSMGYSPLPGLMMSTRCGDIDPMLMIYLMTTFGYQPDELMDMVNKRSGLLGVSGMSSDITDIIRRVSETDEEQPELALNMYVHRLRKYVGSLVAALGGMDVLVFTDDIGVRNWLVREKVCEHLRWCGVLLDEDRNRQAALDRISVLSADGSRVKVLTIPTEEELVICREGVKLMGERTHVDL